MVPAAPQHVSHAAHNDIVNASLNCLSNLASHNMSRPRILGTPGVPEVLVELVSKFQQY
jgi:hypothetical protein